MDPRCTERSSSFDNSSQIQNAPFVWTTHRKMVVLCLSLVYIVGYSNLSILAPFFPSEAQDKGVTSFMIGLIFAMYALVCFIVGPLYGYLIPRYGPRFILITGLFLGGGANILLGFCNLLPEGTVFVTFCLLLRAVSAFGGAAYETSGMSIAMENFPDHVGRITGLLETAVGIGYCIGPALGGALHSIGGFRLPFLAMGVVMLLAMPAAYFILPKCEVVEQIESKTSILSALKIPGVAIVALCLVFAGFAFTFIEPILEPYYKKIGVGSSRIGLIFTLMSVTYGITSPIIGWLCDKTRRYRWFMVSGFFVMSLSYILVGPAPFWTSFLPTRKVWLVCVAFLLSGISSGFLVAPAMPDMLRSAKRRGMPSDLSTNSTLSGISTSSMNLGSVCGPLLAGFLNERIGFQWANSVAAFILLFQALLLAIFTICDKTRRTRRYRHNVDEIEDENKPLLKPV